MNYIYPAVFYQEDDGRYSVIFPDLNDLATYGDNLADAFAMAQEACGQYLFTSLRDGDVFPAPSTLDAVEKGDENAIVNMVCVNLSHLRATIRHQGVVFQFLEISFVLFPPYKYIITRILRNVNKNIRKIRKK